ncbi:hypothetical protein QOT17_013456 [Balamuthia mandrillaris]
MEAEQADALSLATTTPAGALLLLHNAALSGRRRASSSTRPLYAFAGIGLSLFLCGSVYYYYCCCRSAGQKSRLPPLLHSLRRAIAPQEDEEEEEEEIKLDFTQACLPEELILHIFCQCNANDLRNAACVSREWNRFCSDQMVWKEVYRRKWPKLESRLQHYEQVTRPTPTGWRSFYLQREAMELFCFHPATSSTRRRRPTFAQLSSSTSSTYTSLSALEQEKRFLRGLLSEFFSAELRRRYSRTTSSCSLLEIWLEQHKVGYEWMKDEEREYPEFFSMHMKALYLVNIVLGWVSQHQEMLQKDKREALKEERTTKWRRRMTLAVLMISIAEEHFEACHVLESPAQDDNGRNNGRRKMLATAFFQWASTLRLLLQVSGSYFLSKKQKRKDEAKEDRQSTDLEEEDDDDVLLWFWGENEEDVEEREQREEMRMFELLEMSLQKHEEGLQLSRYNYNERADLVDVYIRFALEKNNRFMLKERERYWQRGKFHLEEMFRLHEQKLERQRRRMSRQERQEKQLKQGEEIDSGNKKETKKEEEANEESGQLVQVVVMETLSEQETNEEEQELDEDEDNETGGVLVPAKVYQGLASLSIRRANQTIAELESWNTRNESKLGEKQAQKADDDEQTKSTKRKAIALLREGVEAFRRTTSLLRQQKLFDSAIWVEMGDSLTTLADLLSVEEEEEMEWEKTFREGENVYNEILEREPDDVDALNELGILYTKRAQKKLQLMALKQKANEGDGGEKDKEESNEENGGDIKRLEEEATLFFAKAEESFQQLEKNGVWFGVINLACLYALRGNEEETKRCLLLCLERGDLGMEHMEDSDFDGFREKEWFVELQQRLEEKNRTENGGAEKDEQEEEDEDTEYVSTPLRLFR